MTAHSGLHASSISKFVRGGILVIWRSHSYFHSYLSITSHCHSYCSTLFRVPTMAIFSHSAIARLFLLLLLLAWRSDRSVATDHIVGANLGWNPNINYSSWSHNQTFFVGDLICMFNFISFLLVILYERPQKVFLVVIFLECGDVFWARMLFSYRGREKL